MTVEELETSGSLVLEELEMSETDEVETAADANVAATEVLYEIRGTTLEAEADDDFSTAILEEVDETSALKTEAVADVIAVDATDEDVLETIVELGAVEDGDELMTCELAGLKPLYDDAVAVEAEVLELIVDAMLAPTAEVPLELAMGTTLELTREATLDPAETDAEPELGAEDEAELAEDEATEATASVAAALVELLILDETGLGEDDDDDDEESPMVFVTEVPVVAMTTE